LWKCDVISSIMDVTCRSVGRVEETGLNGERRGGRRVGPDGTLGWKREEPSCSE
jgi:hypothetical protein